MHNTLRMTSAVAAGIADRLWTMENIVAEMDARKAPPKQRGPNKKRAD